MSIIRNAARLAHNCHAGQTRRGGKPYIEHPHRVADMVMLLDIETPIITDEMIAAAWLHDVYEDCDITPFALIEATQSIVVNKYVRELTNLYTKKACPELNRRGRKMAEARRLAQVSPQAQIIKLCDRIDNLKTIHKKGKKFTLFYCDESDVLAEALVAGPKLQAEVFRLTKLIRETLK
jgi:(p)ppGpp synthase/HD superfamily hydrolase